jgi:hypothetical protein
MMDETATEASANADARPAAPAQAAPNEAVRRVNWDDVHMQTSFANVVNVLNTREEFALLFGTNQTWNVARADELHVRLDHRIVLTPHAAKRTMMLLTERIKDYESRFGTIQV